MLTSPKPKQDDILQKAETKAPSEIARISYLITKYTIASAKG